MKKNCEECPESNNGRSRNFAPNHESLVTPQYVLHTYVQFLPDDVQLRIASSISGWNIIYTYISMTGNNLVK